MPFRLRCLLHRAFHFLADSGHAAGQAGGRRCVQLAEDSRCMIFGDPRRPLVCGGLKARTEMCSDKQGLPGREYALAYLDRLELDTRPD